MEELPNDIKKLNERIKKFQHQTQAAENTKKSQIRIALEGMFRLATEFVAPVLIALCIGYVMDSFWNTKPIFMLVLVLFGCAAGVLNLYKAAQQMEKDLGEE